METVRRIYDLFGRAVELVRDERWDEWDSLPEWDLYDPDVVLEELAEIPDSDTYEGVEGIKRWFRAGVETFQEGQWEPRAVTAHGPRVFADVHGRFRGAGSGVAVEVDVFHVFTFRDGRITRISGFLDRQTALRAAGLSEP